MNKKDTPHTHDFKKSDRNNDKNTTDSVVYELDIQDIDFIYTERVTFFEENGVKTVKKEQKFTKKAKKTEKTA